MHLISKRTFNILLPDFHKDKNSKHILFSPAPDKPIFKVLI